MGIEPFMTKEGIRFFDSIEGVADQKKKRAIGVFLNELGKQMLGRSIEAKPEMYGLDDNGNPTS